MSLLNNIINNTPPAKNRTEFRREVKGSSPVPLDVGTIPADGYKLFTFSNHEKLAGFVPLDFLKVDNKSSNDILVMLDQDEDRAIPVASGQTTNIDGLGKFRTLKIKNLESGVGAEIPEDELRITAMRTPRDRSDDYQERKEMVQGF